MGNASTSCSMIGVSAQRPHSQHYVIALDMQFSIAKSEQANNGEKVLTLPPPFFDRKISE